MVCGTHYSEIYNFEGGDHSEPSWDVDYQLWRYYEGYTHYSREKGEFLESINYDHSLWSMPGNADRSRSASKVSFNDEGEVRYTTTPGDGTETDQHKEKLDMEDRENRASWNFAKMLCDYYEKTKGSVEKKEFFKCGGKGEKWSNNKELMDKLGPIFRATNGLLENDDFMIALSDQTVKDYPKSHFRDLYRIYTEFMESISSLRATAPEFIPGKVWCQPRAPLSRTSPKSICGVYKVDKIPQKPSGPPPPKRPSSSSKDPSISLVGWNKKDESRITIEDLEKKLDLLISMHGPVVTAEQT
tara:strand:- start:3855 stop:4754 length:900 start_codon:yes stop_codon:yes gene_type:complete